MITGISPPDPVPAGNTQIPVHLGYGYSDGTLEDTVHIREPDSTEHNWIPLTEYDIDNTVLYVTYAPVGSSIDYELSSKDVKAPINDISVYKLYQDGHIELENHPVNTNFSSPIDDGIVAVTISVYRN